MILPFDPDVLASPLIVTRGAEVYPEPTLVIVTDVITPEPLFAKVAIAPVPFVPELLKTS